jgi:hypothetical protein
VAEADVRAWLQGVLIEEAGFSPDEADHATQACCTWHGSFSLGQAISAAIGARATSRLPGGKDWWCGSGRWAKDYLLAGQADSATYRIAEMLAEPAPDEWDPNWPDYKRFKVVSLPDGAVVGDEFVVGNGEGERGRFRVEERDGRVGAALIGSSWALDDLWESVNREADSVLKA